MRSANEIARETIEVWDRDATIQTLEERIARLVNETRAAALDDVEEAIRREAEAFGDEDIASAIVTVASVAIDSLKEAM